MSLEGCEAVRTPLREKLVVSGKITPRSPDLRGFQGTRVPGVRLLSATWGLLSIMILTRCLRSLIGVEEIVFGENFDDDSVRVVARPD